MGQKQLSLLALNARRFQLKLAFACVEVFPVFFKLCLILAELLVSLLLYEVELFLQAFRQLDLLVKLFPEVGDLADRVAAGKLQSFVERRLLAFELLDFLVKLLHLRAVALRHLLHALLELKLHRRDSLAVTHIGLVLAVVLDLLQLVDCLLELLLGVLEILLGLLFLFLQKFKFTFPKRAVLVVIIDLVLELD